VRLDVCKTEQARLWGHQRARQFTKAQLTLHTRTHTHSHARPPHVKRIRNAPFTSCSLSSWSIIMLADFPLTNTCPPHSPSLRLSLPSGGPGGGHQHLFSARLPLPLPLVGGPCPLSAAPALSLSPPPPPPHPPPPPRRRPPRAALLLHLLALRG